MAHRMGSPGIFSRRSAVVVAVLAALLVFAGIAAASASASPPPLLWMVNGNRAALSTLDIGTGQEVGKPVAVGNALYSIAMTPDAGTIYVGNGSDETVSAVDAETREVEATIPVAGNPDQLAVSPDGRRLFVSPLRGERVTVVDTATNEVVAEPAIGADASTIAVTPSGSQVWVGTESESIEILSGSTGKPTGKSIPLDGVPTELVFSPDGKTAYVALERGPVVVIDTGLDSVTDHIDAGVSISSMAMSPDGKSLYAAGVSAALMTIDTASGVVVGYTRLPSGSVDHLAVTPDGKTAVVAILRFGEGFFGSAETEIQTVNLQTGALDRSFQTNGFPSALLFAPGQSPTAAFTAPDATATVPTAFSGAASSDPDGTIASWSWEFGDGGTATGVSPTHTYSSPGIYTVKLSVTDEEGCGEEMIFTGRTAYCSGGTHLSVTHLVNVKPAPTPPSTAPSNRFTIGRVLHNRRNGTVRMQVRLPSAGYVLLFGKQVHAVSRKSKGVQTMWLTIHARVELNKRLKKILRAPVRIRITFTPNGGTARTVHRTVTLQRTARHKHHHTSIAHSRR
jgi:YVTN family beta-propeller protein